MSDANFTTSTVSYKSVPDFPDYRVGDDGSVWSKRLSKGKNVEWRRLSANPDSHGYSVVILSNGHGKKGFKVHTLVLTLFVGPRPNGTECCHYNGIRVDNRLDNLRWDTPQANAEDKIRHGTAGTGSQNPRAKLTELDVLEIRRLAPVTKRITLAKRFGVSDTLISQIVLGQVWKSVSLVCAPSK